jgi:hypothetical protein
VVAVLSHYLPSLSSLPIGMVVKVPALGAQEHRRLRLQDHADA